jgi:hypothetical protein
LTTTVHANAQLQARHDEILTEHTKQLEGLWEGRACGNDRCLRRQGLRQPAEIEDL